ncbi:hypothetical protein NHX12_013464 [Muraenolepis orangiensis]|uniref:Uncharacterized protein n=1 Tax=Muraenolepis orangiensis TaxID=630683 RepID=A0A9Q0DDU7_9TELE|nr:hypothetical protein NHX12_013464 [Muraenolepis orangiensis]
MSSGVRRNERLGSGEPFWSPFWSFSSPLHRPQDEQALLPLAHCHGPLAGLDDEEMFHHSPGHLGPSRLSWVTAHPSAARRSPGCLAHKVGSSTSPSQMCSSGTH